jgi:hypothetical protein
MTQDPHQSLSSPTPRHSLHTLRLLPPSLKFPLRPSPQRAKRERQSQRNVAKPGPSRSGSNGRDAGKEVISPNRATLMPAAWPLIPRSRPRRSGSIKRLVLPSPRLQFTASRSDSLDTSPNTQGTQATTGNSGPCTQGGSWPADRSQRQLMNQFFPIHLTTTTRPPADPPCNRPNPRK